MHGVPEDDIKAEINVTPLVDVVLVLLIIFMVTARFTLPPTIKVDLPRASAAEKSDERPRVGMVTLKADGTIVFDDRPIAAETLAAALEAFHAGAPDGQVVINADEKVLHGAVIRVLDQAKRAGVERVAVAVQETRE